MTVMTDFQLNKLCLAHRTIKQHALDKEMVMDAGKVQVFKKLLLDLKQKVSANTIHTTSHQYS
jgi:hypothetical protein